MKNSNNFPPLGMCGGDHFFNSGKVYPLRFATLAEIIKSDLPPKSSLKGNKTYTLGKWCDCVVLVNLKYRGVEFKNIEAVIDTGAYRSNISREMLFRLGCIETDGFIGQNAHNVGVVYSPSFTVEMQIEGFEGSLTDSFVETPVAMEYPVLLGTRFLKLCQLNYSGKNETFDLVL